MVKAAMDKKDGQEDALYLRMVWSQHNPTRKQEGTENGGSTDKESDEGWSGIAQGQYENLK